MGEPVSQGPGEGKRLVAGPTTTLVKVPGATTDGRLSAVEMHLDGGWEGPPPHRHERIDHLWWVLDGEVAFQIGDTTNRATAGTCVFVPAGATHGFSTAGGAGAVVLQVDTPEALDGYFADLAAAFPNATPPVPAVVGEIMHRHDTHPVNGRQEKDR